MAKNNNLGDLLTAIANAIRTKKGTAAQINAQDFDTEILALPTGGGDLLDISPITENGIYTAGTELTALDSLTFTGNAYIPTDIAVPNGCDWDIEARFKFTQALSGTNKSALFGSKGTSYQILLNQTSNNIYLYMHSEYNYGTSPSINTEYTLTKNGNSTTLNGSAFYKNGNPSIEAGNTLDLFAYNEGAEHSRKFIGVFRYLKFLSGGNVIHWFIPVRDDNNVPYILDKVTHRLYSIVGTGVSLGSDTSESFYDGFASPLTVNVAKYGVTINGLLGDVNGSGVLQYPREQTSLNFIGVKEIPAYLLRYKFADQSNIIGVSFPDLETIGSTALSNAFYITTVGDGNINSLDMSNVRVVAANGMQYAFYRQKLTDVDVNMPLLNTVSLSSFVYAFYGSDIKSFTTNALTNIPNNTTFQYAFYGCTNPNFEVHFNNLRSINANNVFQYAFYNSKLFQNKIAHPFPDLTTINGTGCFGNGFYSSKCIRMVFDKLQHIGNEVSSTVQTFYQAFTSANMSYETGYTNDYDRRGVFFPSLITLGYPGTSSNRIMGNLFQSANNHTLHFYDLTTINNNATSSSNGHFNACNALRIYMPKVTSFGTYGQYTFYSSTGTQELHFGIENEATIKALSGYTSKFGATNATIYFDMVNHITVGGVVYDRDGAKCDLDNWYFAWTNGSTTIYTTDFKAPAVGSTTYTKSGTTYTASGTITAVA